MSAAATLSVATPERPVDASALSYRELVRGPFWRRIPAYANVTEEQFLDHRWQATNTVTRPARLLETLRGLVSPAFARDVEQGFRRAPMSLRVSPYLLGLIDWTSPYADPLRIQFIPLASELVPDHPKLTFDSLHEQADSPISGLVHRYPDKALFLALDTCPVYCRYCTRSYAVGNETAEVEKVSLKVSNDRWAQAFAYIRSRPELADIVVSGGDAYQLRAAQVREIGEALLAIPNVRRMRFATKGLAVMPQKLVTDMAWTDALTHVVERGRRLHKEVVLHTHFNHPNEITGITEDAMGILTERGITVRYQAVLQAGVNDTPEVMTLLVKRLGHLNVQGYYVYVHDLVKGVEDLRTTVQRAITIEKHVRGCTAGFNTPTFVVDAPGGGGKRDVHSYEHYDRESGISVYRAPAVRPAELFLYFDPIHQLSPEMRRRWRDAKEQDAMIETAIAKAKACLR